MKSIEDHGYILDLGVSEVSGFLTFKDVEAASSVAVGTLRIGSVYTVGVTKMASNGRSCNVTLVARTVKTASVRILLALASVYTLNTVQVSEVSNVASVLPGLLVQGIITAIQPNGLNLQILGFYHGTIDQFHLPPGDVEEKFQLGQKVKARILYDISPSTPPRFALSLSDHVIAFTDKWANTLDGKTNTVMYSAYPVGTVLQAVKVLRVESERGLVVEVTPGLEGFVHVSPSAISKTTSLNSLQISQVSDDHIPSLSSSSGAWKVGTVHRARVTGHYFLDGLLQLTMKASVLEQKFLQVGEVHVGEVIKGTVKKLTDSALFVSISGNVDGVVWPNHYADIVLKHPQKRFKPGGSVKCRVRDIGQYAHKNKLTSASRRFLLLTQSGSASR